MRFWLILSYNVVKRVVAFYGGLAAGQSGDARWALLLLPWFLYSVVRFYNVFLSDSKISDEEIQERLEESADAFSQNFDPNISESFRREVIKSAQSPWVLAFGFVLAVLCMLFYFFMGVAATHSPSTFWIPTTVVLVFIGLMVREGFESRTLSDEQ